jgi:hypothetical protein
LKAWVGSATRFIYVFLPVNGQNKERGFGASERPTE